MAYIPYPRTVTIANAGTVSDALELNQATLLGVITPAALTGTEMSFQVSADGTTYVALYDGSGLAYSVYVGTSRAVPLDGAAFMGWRFVKVVSNAAEGGARSITLVARIVD